MSRIGKLGIKIPYGVKVVIDDLSIDITGPLGRINKVFVGDITIYKQKDMLIVKPIVLNKITCSLWGTVRSLCYNMIVGVVQGFEKKVELVGVGYRAYIEERKLNLLLGKSYIVKLQIPERIVINIIEQQLLVCKSIDKQLLGQYIALLKRQKKINIYSGKGIRVIGEFIERKELRKN